MSTFVPKNEKHAATIKEYVKNSIVLSTKFTPGYSVAGFCGYGGTFAVPKGAFIKPSSSARKPSIKPINEDAVAFRQVNEVFTIDKKTHIHYSLKVRKPEVPRVLNEYKEVCINAKNFSEPKAVRLPNLVDKVSEQVYHCRYQYLFDIKRYSGSGHQIQITDPEEPFKWPPVQFAVPYDHIAQEIKEALKGKTVIFLVNTETQVRYVDTFEFYGGKIVHESQLFNNGNYNTEKDYMLLLVVSFKE
jgi:hypothetical protein